MTHFGWVRRRLARSLRIRVGVVVLALIALPALFAELVAADAPLLAVGARGVTVLPAIVERATYDALTPGEIAERHEGDFTVWPLIRSGPRTPAAAGPHAAASLTHPLGTDWAGRDVTARLVYGARHALGLTLAALLISLVFGGVLGAVAGLRGGFWDDVLTRPVELIETFPAVVVVAVVRAVDPSLTPWSLVLAIAAVRWAEVARLVRAEVIRVSSMEFVVSARAIGCTQTRILRRHVLPHATRPVVVSLLFGVASVVLLEVAISYLGLGLPGSWGTLIAEGLVEEHGSRLTWCAATALALTVGAAYLVADALGETLDARVAKVRGPA